MQAWHHTHAHTHLSSYSRVCVTRLGREAIGEKKYSEAADYLRLSHTHTHALTLSAIFVFAGKNGR
jgi:hypothetical protein